MNVVLIFFPHKIGFDRLRVIEIGQEFPQGLILGMSLVNVVFIFLLIR